MATFLGLRTLIHPAPDLASAKVWFTEALGAEPYFDQPFYVGFNVGGYELGLDPDADPAAGPCAYWGVGDVDVALAELVSGGASVALAPREVGDGIRVARVTLPHQLGTIGLIENPHFELPAEPPSGTGPGR